MDVVLREGEEEYDLEVAKNSIHEIAAENELCSIATISEQEQRPHIATVFYAYDDAFTLYFASDPESEHGQQLEDNSAIAISIYADGQQQLGDKRGLQVFGEATELEETSQEGRAAYEEYTDRFPVWEDFAKSPEDVTNLDSSFYKVTPERIKIFDEESFGTEVWVNVEVQ